MIAGFLYVVAGVAMFAAYLDAGDVADDTNGKRLLILALLIVAWPAFMVGVYGAAVRRWLSR